MCKFQDEIRSAQAELASWPEGKKSSVQLEGTDKYYEQEKRRAEVERSLKVTEVFAEE